MNLALEGRRAAVPAATSGLGLAVATALAAEGAAVAICGRELGKAEGVAAGIGAVPFAADVSTSAGAREFFEAAEEELGGIDILILNGPGPSPGTFASTAADAYPAALEAGILPGVEMCHLAVPGMRERGWGRVVAITSVGVRQPIANLILSNTARSGLTAFLKTLAREVAADGVTVNSLQPGLHGTKRLEAVYGDRLDGAVEEIPARKLGDVESFGQVAAFLCSEQATYLTGAAIPVDGGLNAGLF
jgi:3-oxoacyl-[acyl-carrier protein] reductase